MYIKGIQEKYTKEDKASLQLRDYTEAERDVLKEEEKERYLPFRNQLRRWCFGPLLLFLALCVAGLTFGVPIMIPIAGYLPILTMCVGGYWIYAWWEYQGKRKSVATHRYVEAQVLYRMRTYRIHSDGYSTGHHHNYGHSHSHSSHTYIYYPAIVEDTSTGYRTVMLLDRRYKEAKAGDIVKKTVRREAQW